LKPLFKIKLSGGMEMKEPTESHLRVGFRRRVAREGGRDRGQPRHFDTT